MICATALVGLAETVVGIGALDLDAGPAQPPALLVADGRLTEGLEPLLRDALIGRAQALSSSRVA